jgi:hypothetical protein
MPLERGAAGCAGLLSVLVFAVGAACAVSAVLRVNCQAVLAYRTCLPESPQHRAFGLPSSINA